jgi:exopolyphosphatase/guanosine-5'-triphosphate,3'-diphosphate pyrophosphatase
MSRLGAIDIGTNSVLLTIAEEHAGELTPLVERATITRLGAGVDRTKSITHDAVERTLQCLSEYAELLREYAVATLDVVGTSALRDASGAREFSERARAILGVLPRVITGDEEAALTFEGALIGITSGDRTAVVDIGGGSSEFIIGRPNTNPAQIEFARSLDIGSVRLFERHVHRDPPRQSELDAVRADIRRALTELPEPPTPLPLVGVAGTVTSIAAIALELDDYDAARVHGFELEGAHVARIAEELALLPLAARRELRGLEPARADVIVVGALLLLESLAWAKSERVIVSDRGVRWGLLRRRQSGLSPRLPPPKM